MSTDENHNEELINTITMEAEENTHIEDLTQLFEMEGYETSKDGMRPTKRRREDDEWSEVRNSKDRMRRVRGITELRVTCKDKFPKQFALAKLFKEQRIMNITKVKHINPYKIIVELKDAESAEKLGNSEHFKGLGWRFQRPFEVGLSYGVIKNIDLDISENELRSCLSSTCKVVNVRRLQRRDREAAIWTDSETWRIGFEGPSLPSFVLIYEMRVLVEPYVFPVTQCSRCWRYGHSVKMCPTTNIICPKCGGKHANCDTISFKCVNCTQNHMALDKTCPVYIKERKIRTIMSQFNVSYRKALDMYIPPPAPAYEAEVNRHTLTPSYEINPATQTPTMTTNTPMSPVLQSKATFAQKTARPVRSNETVSTKIDITNGPQTKNVPQMDKTQTEKEGETIKKSKQKKHKKKGPHFETPQEQDCDMDFHEHTYRNDATEEEDDSKNEDSEDNNSFGWLVDKIKYILFVRNDSFKVKIISVVQISMEWAISFFLNKIIPKDLSSFKKYFRNEYC